MTNKELKDAIKLLITTLDDTTWDEGHPGYSDSEPGYLCPECSCTECYRVSCEFNKSELFKKLHKEFPELYENEIKQMKDIKDKSEVIGKLTDAKELLKKWVSLLGFKAGKLAEQTKQFLSEVENV